MNVLVDRHHAGLYNSLQLLFEDRLGHALYTPIGHDWWDEGYWQFGIHSWGDDRLARQFLNDAGWASGLIGRLGDPNTHCSTTDPEFPGRPIYGVSLEQAREVTWGAVIATVQDNQPGFHRFAQEHGAKYIVQVGNTGQQIDWSLDPLVLNSSEMPIIGRGVSIGQEFDSEGLFAYCPPPKSPAMNAEGFWIGTFVNCFPSIGCYPLFLEARRLLPASWTMWEHGIDGRSGNIKPIMRTAEIMRRCSWGWHDKEHGDGFGHVIHYWAAIGRPLIGHASHYNGKRAESLWRDLETCIDLDLHPLPEAIALIREISSDPERHERMCRAIRAAFDAETDWQRDADAVRALIS